MADIDSKDQRQLAEWLKQQPSDVCQVIAARAALRVFPVATLGFGHGKTDKTIAHDTVLPLIRAAAMPVGKIGVQNNHFRAAATNAAAVSRFNDSRAVSVAASSATHAAGAATFDAATNAATAIDAAEYAVEAASVEAFDEYGASDADPTAAAAKDAQFIDDLGSPEMLAMQPLWPNSTPVWVYALWTQLKNHLLALDEDWEVWIDWYDARLEGDPSPGGEELDIFRVTLPEDLWKQGPKDVNAAIKAKEKALTEAKEDENTANAMSDGEMSAATQPPRGSLGVPTSRGPGIHPAMFSNIAQTPLPIVRSAEATDIVLTEIPKVPPLRPSAIEPIVVDDRIVLPRDGAIGDLSVAGHRASFSSVKRSLEKLLAGARSIPNIDARFLEFGQRAVGEFPAELPTHDQLFDLGHTASAFQGYAVIVREEWPNIHSAQYHAFNLQFDQCLRQYEPWREFTRNASHERYTPEQIADIRNQATAISRSLRNEESVPYVDSAIPDELQNLNWREQAAWAEAIVDDGANLLASDILESISNIFKTIAIVALPYVEAFADGAKKEVFERGQADGRKFVKWTRGVLIGGVLGLGAQIGYLISAYPRFFDWLGPILQFLKLGW